jgi:hypothetical protein
MAVISTGFTIMMASIFVSTPGVGISKARADGKQYYQNRSQFFHDADLLNFRQWMALPTRLTKLYKKYHISILPV